jgi:Fe-S-cluster containining protein
LKNTELPEEYRKLLETAKSKKREISKKLAGLSGKKIAGFDDFVHACHDEAFSGIDCSKCANCCSGLGPLFTQSDISRLSSFTGIKPGDFSQKYLRIDEDGDTVFREMPCPFLDENLCSCYEARPRACREYPHTDEKYMLTKMKRLAQNAQYCPAAFRVAMMIIEKYCR